MSVDPGSPERQPLGPLDALDGTTWSPWPLPDVVDTTPSTMADVEARATQGAPEGTVVVAEEQTAGRGRRGRSWDSAPRAGLWWSVLLRPTTPVDRLGWLPLVIGVGVARALRASAGADARLKWPNDVLVGEHKVAGILAERLADGAVVVGVGINVDQAEHELPAGGASLGSLGLPVDRTALLVDVLASVAEAYRQWQGGLAIAEEYADLCVTLMGDVIADLGGRSIEGRATGLGPGGELVIEDLDGIDHVVSAGDVTLRRMSR
ncbi:MAG: biotin--[acetyl-CoA-carboxylase] ligase [Candidatus Nanopelagicales bacterium]